MEEGRGKMEAKDKRGVREIQAKENQLDRR